jgi:4-diphosphocytidyl-2-C-methyl-D-erythritol kinase
MKALYDVPAPAKLNLFLHVVGRRIDGYHELQSVFMMLDWCDQLHFERRPAGRLSREDLSLPLPDDDLILRAARALQAHTGCPLGAHIAVEKRVPAQAGLGGGSSDAASCLLALNRLWGLGLSRRALAEIGLSLGADVPFFIGGRNAWVEGIGESLTPVTVPPAQFVVIKPTTGLETGRIFSHPALKRDSARATISGFAADPFGFGANDLQPVARLLCPEVDEALGWLERAGLHGRMTGSGSAVYAALAPGQDMIGIKPESWRFHVCGNMAAHPLLDWAGSDN